MSKESNFSILQTSTPFLSVLSSSVNELTVLSSRFIATIFPLEKREENESILISMKNLYPKATHYCYALRYDGYEYCSDDGEPPHSAGLPILNAIKGGNLNRTMIVVVRYFGGTKLGMPRLNKAYRDVSKMVVDSAKKVELVPGLKAMISLDYSSFEAFKRVANKCNIRIENPSFETKVNFFALGSDKILLPFIKGFGKSVLSLENIWIKQEQNNDSSK